jgi:hypothetical protein
MKKFNVLFDEGLSEHSIIGFDDGTWEIISQDQMKNSQWFSQNLLDDSIRVLRRNIIVPVRDRTSYPCKELSRPARPSSREVRRYRIENEDFDIKFLADYIVEDRTWFVVSDRPDVSPSGH